MTPKDSSLVTPTDDSVTRLLFEMEDGLLGKSMSEVDDAFHRDIAFQPDAAIQPDVFSC